MLKITNLRKKYKNFEVLKGLNMNIERGDVYGFLGKNGCGKTTTMNIICNIVAKTGGRIEFLPKDVATGTQPQAVQSAQVTQVGWQSSEPQSDNTPSYRPKIGYLTESPALYAFMNGYEYLKYIAACANYTGDVNARITEVLDVVGMTEGANRRIKGYSRGMNQRLGIAAAMFDHPELLILDEPTSALDPEGRAEVMSIIRNLKQSGVTIILCTHIITDVERVANQIGIMKNGIIAEEGSIDSIMAKYRNQSSHITVRLEIPSEQVASQMRMLPSVHSSDYNNANGIVVLGSQDVGTLQEEVMALIVREKIRILEFVSQRKTLEDIYFMITGGQ